jgi:hypothetical protein
MNDIHPVKPLIHLSLWDTPLGALLVFVVLVAAIIGVIYGVRRLQARAQQPILATPPPPPKPATEIVGDALRELERIQPYIEKGLFQELFLESTEIIKLCASDILNVGIRDMTTREIRENTSIPESFRGIILDFLQSVDRLKFDNIPTNEDRAQDIYTLADNSLQAITTHLTDTRA